MIFLVVAYHVKILSGVGKHGRAQSNREWQSHLRNIIASRLQYSTRYLLGISLST
jgi:hypothetical protein